MNLRRDLPSTREDLDRLMTRTGAALALASASFVLAGVRLLVAVRERRALA